VLLCGGHFAYYRTNSNTSFFFRKNDRVPLSLFTIQPITRMTSSDDDDNDNGDGATGNGATGYDDDKDGDV